MSGLATRSPSSPASQTPAQTTPAAEPSAATGPSTSTSTSTSTGAGKTQAAAQPSGHPDVPKSNAQQQEKLRGKEGTDAGLSSYEDALGQWLGGELYKAVAPQLTLQALVKDADNGLTSALKGAAGALGKLKGDVDKTALSNFGKALASEYGKAAGDWLQTDAGKKLAASLADWVDVHPRTIVLVALLAAAGAVLANMDVPTLKAKFGIAKGLSAEVDAKLGKIQSMALQDIKATLSYTSGPLLAAVKVEHKQGGGDTIHGEIGVAKKNAYNIKATVEATKDGFKAYGASGMLQTKAGKVEGAVNEDVGKSPKITGKLTTVDGKTTTVNEVDYDGNTGVFNFKNSRNAVLDSGAKLSTTMGGGSDGSNQVGANVSNLALAEHMKGSAGVQHSTTAKDGKTSTVDTVSGGLAYDDKKNLNLALDASASSDHSGKVSGKGSYKPDKNWTLSGKGEVDWGKKSGYSLGGSAAYQDDKNKLNLSADYASKNHKLDLSLMGERNLSKDFAVRGDVGYESSDNGNKVTAGLHGAYYLNKDVALIGGGRYMLDEKQQSHFIPEVGAQIKGVPLTVGYDTQTKGFVVGASIHF